MGSEPDVPQYNAKKNERDIRKENTRAAYENTAFNRLGQTDTFGNTLDFVQTGKDAQGNPIFRANQQLGQTGQQYTGGLSNLGQEYFSGAQNFLSNPADYSNQATEARIMDLASRRVNPELDRQEDALRNRLANMGLDPTSEAYGHEMRRFGEQRNDATNQMALTARNQALQEALVGRQAQVGEFQQLTAPGVQFGNAVLQPQYANYSGVGINPVDIGGQRAMQYQGQLQQAQADADANAAMWGGIAKLGGSILAAPATGGGSLIGNFLG